MVVSCYLHDNDIEIRKNNVSYPCSKETETAELCETKDTDSFQKAQEYKDKKDEDLKSDFVDSLPMPFKYLFLAVRFVVGFFKNLFNSTALLSTEGKFSQFEKDHNPDVFNKYLLYRNSIAADSEKLEEYEKQVQIILSKTSIMHADKPSSDRNYCTNYEDCSSARPAECYLIAAFMVELGHNRFDEIKKVLDRNNGLKIRLVKEIKVKETKCSPDGKEKEVHSSIGGFYDEDENVAVLCTEDLLSGNLNPRDGYNLVIHEVMGHGIDVNNNSGKCDGIIDGMTEEEVKEFTEARDELFSLYENYRKNLSSTEVERVNNGKIDPATGLRNYAFKNYVEFLSTTLEIFMETPEVLFKASKKLYNVYKNFFGVDPLEIKQILKLTK